MIAKHYWISSAPRTGSMWVFNVVREIFLKYEHQVLPELIPQTSDEFFKLFSENLNDNDSKKIFVYKVHVLLKNNLPFSKIITIIRDPREIIVSFMRFMKSDFNKSFLVAKSMMSYIELYNNYNSDIVLILRYEEIIKNPTQAVNKILHFVNLKLSKNVVEKIVTKFDKKNNKNLIKKNDDLLKEQMKNKENIDKKKIVYLSENNFRSFDINTGFQTGHISDMKKEDYRNFLTKKQIEQVKNIFGNWLHKNGYAKDY